MAANDYRALAEYYDLIYGKVGPDDIPFYLDHAARQGGADGRARILELGCGTGRITLPLARAGHRLTALDLSPAMLHELHAKLAQEPVDVQARVGLVEGDMSQLDLRLPAGAAMQFDLIIAPFRAFQHLLESEQQRECLTRIAAHLAPGGVYIHDQFEPDYRFVVERMQRGPVFGLDCEVDLADGGLLQRHSLLQYDLGRQRLDAQFRIEDYAADGVLRRCVLERIALRMTHRQEIIYLLELAGLRVREALDGYGGKPLGPELASELLLVCQRA